MKYIVYDTKYHCYNGGKDIFGLRYWPSLPSEAEKLTKDQANRLAINLNAVQINQPKRYEVQEVSA